MADDTELEPVVFIIDASDWIGGAERFAHGAGTDARRWVRKARRA